MKKYFIPFLLMAAAAVAACQPKENIEEPALEGSYIYTLNASAPEVTKSDYDASGAFSWSASDQISVLFHKGDDNKFFTLSNTSGAGASATFSGAIDAGYEIGASTDGTQWALYPANDENNFVAADSKPVKLHIPAETDFTTSEFSANLPMYAHGNSGSFAFQHLGAAYRFTFTEVSAAKAKLVVENQTTYQLSGDIPIHMGDIYSDQGYASVGSEKGSLTQIANVVGGEVSFYVPVRYWADYQPNITLYDADTNDPIFSKTAGASKQLTSLGKVKPFSFSVTGFTYEFPSKFGINWNDVTISAEGDSGSKNSGIKDLKATADASYLYLYFVVDKNKLTTDPANEYANQQVVYLGDVSDPNCTKTSWIWGSEGTYTKDATGGWLTYYGAPAFYCWEDIVGSDTGDKAGSAAEYKDDFYYEMRIPRDNTKAPMTSTSPSTAHVGMILYYQKIHGVSGSGDYMIAPPTESHSGQLLNVPLPAYVVP